MRRQWTARSKQQPVTDALAVLAALLSAGQRAAGRRHCAGHADHPGVIAPQPASTGCAEHGRCAHCSAPLPEPAAVHRPSSAAPSRCAGATCYRHLLCSSQLGKLVKFCIICTSAWPVWRGSAAAPATTMLVHWAASTSPLASTDTDQRVCSQCAAAATAGCQPDQVASRCRDENCCRSNGALPMAMRG